MNKFTYMNTTETDITETMEINATTILTDITSERSRHGHIKELCNNCYKKYTLFFNNCLENKIAFSNMVDYSLESGINWGRIISLFTLAKLIIDNENDDDVKDQLRLSFGLHLNNKVKYFVSEEGGWKTLKRFESNKQSLEHNMTNSLLGITLGLSIFVIWFT